MPTVDSTECIHVGHCVRGLHQSKIQSQASTLDLHLQSGWGPTWSLGFQGPCSWRDPGASEGLQAKRCKNVQREEKETGCTCVRAPVPLRAEDGRAKPPRGERGMGSWNKGEEVMLRKENHGSGRKDGNSETETRRSASTGGKQREAGLVLHSVLSSTPCSRCWPARAG